jgi:hypothetical protein
MAYACAIVQCRYVAVMRWEQNKPTRQLRLDLALAQRPYQEWQVVHARCKTPV